MAEGVVHSRAQLSIMRKAFTRWCIACCTRKHASLVALNTEHAHLKDIHSTLISKEQQLQDEIERLELELQHLTEQNSNLQMQISSKNDEIVSIMKLKYIYPHSWI